MPVHASGCPPVIPDDLSCDGVIDGFDIDGLVLVLSGTPPDYRVYYAQYPDCNYLRADMNGDGLG